VRGRPGASDHAPVWIVIDRERKPAPGRGRRGRR
jgi:hypothetical protein